MTEQPARETPSDSKGGDSESHRDSLKAREYQDAQGKEHHHTRTYMAEHEGEKGEGQTD